MCDFKPGDEVVCVDDSPCEGAMPIRSVVRGGHYQVDAVWFQPSAESVLLSLIGVNAAEDMTFAGYGQHRFRRIQRKTTSLTIESFMVIKPDQYEEPRKPKTPCEPVRREGVE